MSSFRGEYFPVRVKLYPTSTGSRVAMVQTFNDSRFRADCGVIPRKSAVSTGCVEDDENAVELARDIIGDIDDVERATRRAKIAAFDKISCNPDMNVFLTITYAAPEDIAREYDEVYRLLRPWLSNLVQRHGFKYVCVPEHHKSGRIHFHMICSNPGDCLRLVPAVNPSGNIIRRRRKIIYNATAWKRGFSTAEIIGATETDRTKVAKYIYKYMGKESGKIGGRYLLTGGEFALPLYEYYTLEEWDIIKPELGDTVFERSVECGDGLVYHEYSYN